MMKQAWIIFLKEVLDNSRDRRALSISLLTAVALPALMIGMFVVMKRDIEQKQEKILQVPTQGLEAAEYLAAFLKDHDILLKEMPAGKSIEAVAKENGLALNIDASIGEALRVGEVPRIRIYFDGSRSELRQSSRRLERALSEFAATIVNVRLGNLGVRQELLHVFSINNIDISDQGVGFVSLILGLLPIIMIAASLSGGHYLAVDITAGELEKKSLEPLRQLPVSMTSLLTGKWMAVFAFSLLAAALSGLGFFLMSRLDFVRAFTEINIQVEAWHLVGAFLLLVPFCLLAAAVEILIGSFTKSVKEAQTYIQILIAAGSIPTYLMAIMDMKEKAWSIYVPVISQYFLISRWQRAEIVGTSEILIASAVTLVLAVLAMLAAGCFFKREPTA